MNLDLEDLVATGATIANEEKTERSFAGWILSYMGKNKTESRYSKIWISHLDVALSDPEDARCKRQLWMKYRDYDEEEPTVWERFMWDQGDAMEDRCIWYIYLALQDIDGWGIYDVQAPMHDGLPSDAGGRADVVLRHAPTETYIIVEVKSKRGNWFQYNSDAKPSAKLQVNCYGEALHNMLLDEFEDPEDFTVKTTTLYADREGQNGVREFPLEWVEGVADNAVKQAKKFHPDFGDAEKPGMMAPNVRRSVNKSADSWYVENPWQCRWCRLKDCDGPLPEAVAELDRVENRRLLAKGEPPELDLKIDTEIEVGDGLTSGEVITNLIEESVEEGTWVEK